MNEEKKHIFDHPKNVKRLLTSLYVICAGLLAVDFFFHRHSIHPWESVLGFYALYGFIGCIILVLVAAQMRKIVMRKENYYQQEKDALAKDKPNVDD